MSLQHVVGVFAKRRRELMERALAGDGDAAASLRNADRQREERERLRQKAAHGDVRAYQTLKRRTAMTTAKGRQRAAEEKAKRESGDAEAVAKYEEQKHRSKQRAKERALELSHGPGAAPPAYTSEDEDDIEANERWDIMHHQSLDKIRRRAEESQKIEESNGVFQDLRREDTINVDMPFERLNGRQRRGLRIADLLNDASDEKDERSMAEMEESLRMRRLRLGRKKARLETRLRKVEVEMFTSGEKLEALRWMGELEQGQGRG